MNSTLAVADSAAYGIIRNVEKEKEDARKKRDEERKKQEEVRRTLCRRRLTLSAEGAQGARRGGRQIGRGWHRSEDAQGRRVSTSVSRLSPGLCSLYNEMRHSCSFVCVSLRLVLHIYQALRPPSS